MQRRPWLGWLRGPGRALLVVLWALGAWGCVRKDYPTQPIVESVRLEGVRSVDEDELLQGLATTGSPRFVGLWDGVVFDYEVFDRQVLERDLERVERFYRARGFYMARVTAARVEYVDERRVRVWVEVVEGEPVRIRRTEFRICHGTLQEAERVQRQKKEAAREKLQKRALAGPGEEVRPSSPEELGEVLPCKDEFPQPVAWLETYAATRRYFDTGQLFDERTYEQGKKRLLDEFADRGYAFVALVSRVNVSLADRRAYLDVLVYPGPVATIGEVTIEGLKEIPEDRVRATLGIVPGQRYSRRKLLEAQDALLDLGVFSRVDVASDLTRPESGVVPIRVTLEQADLRTLKIGGGTRLDPIRFSSSLVAGWEDRNFLGGLRRFSIDARPGITWFPTRLPGGAPDDPGFRKPDRALFEYSTSLRLRQPAFLEGRTTGVLQGTYSRYALLYAGHGLREPILGYDEVRASAGVERSWPAPVPWAPKGRVVVQPTYHLQTSFPTMLSDDPEPEGLETLVVSFPELRGVLDLRDDPVRTRRGLYLASSTQVAGHVFGGEVSDVRLNPELRLYTPLSRRVVLAVRGELGLLFPAGYGDTLGESGAGRTSAEPAYVKDQQKLLFRAFYSGGPSSNRGYPFRGVGPHGPLGFLVAGNLRCDFGSSDLPPACQRPLGGLTLWEASLEVRWDVGDPLALAFFADASDVTRRARDLNRAAPHLSPGVGVRYQTPIGPLRLDVGYRWPGLQVIGREAETSDDPTVLTVFPAYGNAGTVFGLPIAVHFAIGEAF